MSFDDIFTSIKYFWMEGNIYHDEICENDSINDLNNDYIFDDFSNDILGISDVYPDDDWINGII